MMIGGRSRGKDRGQWDGWGLEKASKRPAGHTPYGKEKKYG